MPYGTKHSRTVDVDTALAETKGRPDPLAHLVTLACEEADRVAVRSGEEVVAEWRAKVLVCVSRERKAWVPILRPSGPIPPQAVAVRVDLLGIATTPDGVDVVELQAVAA